MLGHNLHWEAEPSGVMKRRAQDVVTVNDLLQRLSQPRGVKLAFDSQCALRTGHRRRLPVAICQSCARPETPLLIQRRKPSPLLDVDSVVLV